MPLILLLIALMPLKNLFLAGSDSGITPIKCLGIICAGYAAVHVVMSGSFPRYLATWQARYYLLYFLLMCSSWALSPYAGTGVFLGITSLLLLYFILLSAIDSVKRLRWLVGGVIGSLGWASLYVIREWQSARGWTNGYRPGWVVGDGNHFAVTAMPAIPLAWYWAQRRGPGWERWFCWGCLLLTLFAVIISSSRGGFLGLAAMMVFVTVRSHGRMRTALVAVLVLLAVFNVVYPYSPLMRLLHPNANDTASSDNHRASWGAGMNMISEHPLTGVGITAFKPQMLNYAPSWYQGGAFQAHNAYISVGAELGVPGELLFVSVLISTYLSLERTYRTRLASPLITQTASALQAALIGSAIGIAFITAEYHEHLWLIIFLSMCLPPLASRSRSKHAAAIARGRRPSEPAGAASGSPVNDRLTV
jgi:O-antigen ligase